MSEDQLKLELEQARDTIRALHNELQHTNSDVLQLTLELEEKINEQARLAAENRRNKNLLEAIFEADPAGLAVVVGPELRFAYVNPAYRYIAPHNGADLVDQDYPAVWASEHSDTCADAIRMVVHNGQPFLKLDFERHFTDGAVRSFTLQARRIEWDLGYPAALIAMWDTTERKQNELLLQQSEAKFRDLANSITDPFTAWDADMRCTYRNQASELATLVSEKEVVGKTFAEIYPELLGAEVHQAYLETLAKRQSHTLEVTWVRPIDQRRFYFEVSLYPTQEGLTAFSRDITARKQADEQIALQSAALAATANGVLITDRKGNVEWVNPAFTTLTGYTLEEAIGKNPRQLVRSGAHDETYFRNLWETILSGQVWRGEIINRRKDGSQYSEEMTITPVADETGEISHFIAVKQDITARLQVEEEVRARNVRVELQRRLLEQREQERLQIARDIHDGPVQELTAAALTLHGMTQDCPDLHQAGAFDAIRSNLQAAISELRGYAQDLRPPVLSKFGLAKAIQAHLETVREKHPELAICSEHALDGEMLSETGRIALYRIYQESLNNIIKHAQATQVTIRLSQQPGEVILEIQDNGIGFEPPRDWLGLARQGHLGLVGIRERAEAIGGRVEIQSKAGQGTRLTVRAPVDPEK